MDLEEMSNDMDEDDMAEGKAECDAACDAADAVSAASLRRCFGARGILDDHGRS